jgi:adenine phosphoribosyltransferase
MDIKQIIKTVDGFPHAGVKFLDITSILSDTSAFKYTVDWFAMLAASNNIKSIVAVDARGFIWAGAVAAATGLPLFLARKPGKLPGAHLAIEYDTEYSTTAVAMQVGQRVEGPVMIIDDIIATGGTLDAVGQIITELWKIESKDQLHAAIADLSFLPGKQRLLDNGCRVASIVTY